jgi:hypothetical protein
VTAPEPYFDDGQVQLFLGDCLDVLAELPDCSIDAVCTDPPYGLEFMGREWDTFKPSQARIRTRPDQRTNPAEGKSVVSVPESYTAGQPFQAWCFAWASECLRVLKPGGYMLAMGGSRTWHRLACAVEDAGFEIRDSVADLTGQDAAGLMWVYAGGFPKSADAGRAIDMKVCPQDGRHFMRQMPANPKPGDHVCPESEEGDPWRGWGTALKPAHEPIVVARKPLAGTVAANVLQFGTGALNIGGCRVGTTRDVPASNSNRETASVYGAFGAGGGPDNLNPDMGRWPPNVLLTHSADCKRTGTREVPSNARSRRKPAGSAKFPGAYGDLVNDQDRAYGNPGAPEVVEVWDCAEAQTIRVKRFTLPDGTVVEPASTSAPVLLGALEAVRDLLPSASRSAGTQSTLGSGQAHVVPGSGPAGSRGDYPADHRSGGAPAREAAEGGRSSAPRLADALESALALGRSPGRTPRSQPGDRPSSSDDAPGSNTPGRTAPGRTGVGDLCAPSASAGKASSTAGTGSLGLLPAGPGDSTPPSSTPASGGSTESIPSRTACTDEEFRLLASSALSEASFEGVVTCTDHTVVLPGCPVAELDRQSGALTSGVPAVRRLSGSDANGNTSAAYGAESRPAGSQMVGYGDTGGASRFFPAFRWQAKAPASERPRLADGTAHPTVKPLTLMQWLVRLVTPPGGLVLDPFGGSGTTAEACVIEGFNCILVEKDPASAELIKARLSKPIQPVMFGEAG